MKPEHKLQLLRLRCDYWSNMAKHYAGKDGLWDHFMDAQSRLDYISNEYETEAKEAFAALEAED